LQSGDGSDYRLKIITNCSGEATYSKCSNSTSVSRWSAKYSYIAGAGAKLDKDPPPKTVWVKVFKSSLNGNGNCKNYKLDFYMK
jgi:hypothetical protein